jgi:Ca2+-binding EF-hand superfamily protein
MNPVVGALDTDGDGEVSASELEQSTASLKKLDKNSDGKLTEDELRPQFGGDRGRGGRGSGGEGMADRLMEYDADKDGKLSRDELSKMQFPPFGGRPGGEGGRPGEGGPRPDGAGRANRGDRPPVEE